MAGRKQPDAEESQWLSAEQAARLMGIPETTFKHFAEQGFFPPGLALTERTLRWKRSEIEAASELLAWLMARRTNVSSTSESKKIDFKAGSCN
jgi:predicted DNA-binding transcriptional regulator AlpA